MPELITKAELEVRLKLHRNTVTRLLAQGRFPHAFRTGGRWRIPVSDLEAFVRSARSPAPPQPESQATEPQL